jgi:glycopeptide antibiotics resistance protein
MLSQLVNRLENTLRWGLPRVTDQNRLEPHYLWIAAGIALAILYGSFFPFGFYLHRDPRGPIGVLLDHGLLPVSREDVVANIFLYIPFGFFIAYAFQGRALAAIGWSTLAGFLLSLFVEVFQFYDFGRVQGVPDIYSNTLGALLGATAASIAWRRTFSIYLTLLFFCWFGSRWYPAWPTLAHRHLGPMLVVTSIPKQDLFRFFAVWLGLGLMLEAYCGLSRSRALLPLLLGISLVLRAFAAYVDPAEVASGAAAVLVWSIVLWKVPARARIGAALFVALVIMLALAPFHVLDSPRTFSWVPFRSFLETSTDTAIRVFFEKAFYYGGMIWLLVRAGLSIGAAAAFGGILVFALRLFQVYLPGRSAEITDATLLLMLAAMMKLTSLADPPQRRLL